MVRLPPRFLCVLILLLTGRLAVTGSQISVGVIVPGGEDFGKEGTTSDQASRGAREGCIPTQSSSCVLNLAHPSSEDESAYADLVPQVASQNDFIIDIGYNAQKATHKAADDHPDKNFAIIDFEFLPPVSNIASVMFRDDQEGYLAGLLAGELAKDGMRKVVVIAGVEQPDQKRKANGFANGVKVSCSDCTVYCHYAKSFTDDQTESSELVKSVISLGGVDVVYSTASTTGTKTLKRLTAENGINVIGSGTDEWMTNWGIGSVPGSEHVLTSTLRDYKAVIRQVTQSMLNGTFTVGNTVKYGVTGDPATSAIKFANYHEAGERFTPELNQKMQDYMARMASEELDTGIDWKKGDNKSGEGKCKPLMKDSTENDNRNNKSQRNAAATLRSEYSHGIVTYVGLAIAYTAGQWVGWNAWW